MTNYSKKYKVPGKRVGGQLVKRPRLSKAQHIAEVAVKGFKAAMFVKNLINSEKKYVTVFLKNHNTNYNGFIDNLFTTTRGTAGVGNRIGTSILLKTVTIRGFVKISDNNSNQIIRLIIFRDHCNTITTPAQYLEDIGDIDAVLSLRQHDSRFNTTKVYDKTFVMDSARNKIQTFQHTFNNINKHVQYDVSGGGDTITHNAFKVILITTTSTSTDSPIMNFLTHVTYIDN